MDKNATDAQIEELERRIASLTQLLEVNKALNATLLSANTRIETLLGKIMDAAADITDSEGASVLLWKHTTQELFFAATTTNSEHSRDLLGKPVPLDSIAGTILREKRLIMVDDTSSDPRHYAQVDKDISYVTRSLLGVPMISKQRAIGVLEVVNKRTLPWTDQDCWHLMVLAEEAAVAIEVAQLLVALQKANNELKEVDKLKSDFIAIASHELRTPLSVILGYASFLQADATTPEVSEHASKVIGSALQLRRIIEDMVNLRYLKQNEAELVRENLRLKELVEDVQRETLTALDASSHHFTMTCPDDIEVFVDRSRAMMALTNLMNNAIRFTPPGGKINLEVKVQGGKEAWIILKDTGIGLEKHELERIFDEFYQVEDHMTRQHGGLGIGLSIARALAAAHGGRIWAESEGLHQGSTFTMTLPLAR